MSRFAFLAAAAGAGGGGSFGPSLHIKATQDHRGQIQNQHKQFVQFVSLEPNLLQTENGHWPMKPIQCVSVCSVEVDK